MSKAANSQVLGIVARFESPAALMKAAEALRDAGYTKFDCHSPFPIHGMDSAMGLRRSALGWVVGLAALIGTSFALWLQWWSSSIEYPLNISGKPFFSYQAYLPVTFALGVLLSAAAALFGMLALNGLPRWHHPVFASKQFERASDDGFFVSIEAEDPKFDARASKEMLRSIGGADVEELQES
ncbi:MAG: DUF3341 domain-containing protein [bacterium]